MSIVRAPESVLQTGSIFQDAYEIIGEVGAGAFGRVYEARHLSTGQRAAIKVLRPLVDSAAADAERVRERFRRETRLCIALTHPHIVRLIDSGESDDGLLYTVFQFVPGATPNSPASGFWAHIRPSGPILSQAISSPTVQTL